MFKKVAKVINFDPTGTYFNDYARKYRCAAVASSELVLNETNKSLDIVSLQLLCQSLELHLKFFIWYTDDKDSKAIKKQYGHNIGKLWEHGKEKDLLNFVAVTDLMDKAVEIVSPYYKDKQFCYLDCEMSHEGQDELRRHPNLVEVLLELTKLLEDSLSMTLAEKMYLKS